MIVERDKKMKVAETAYDSRVAKTYDVDRESEEHWVIENAFVQAFFSKRCPGVILDIPVGTGRFLKSYPESSEVFGVDISEHMLGEAKEKYRSMRGGKVELKVGDAERLVFFDDRSVETIVCFRLMHLLVNKKRLAVLKEFSRVLRGDLLLQVYLSKPKKPLFYRLLRRCVSLLRQNPLANVKSVGDEKPWLDIKSYELTECELLAMCEEANLKVVKRDFLCGYEGSDVCVFTIRSFAF